MGHWPIMSSNNHNRYCHPERSEGSARRAGPFAEFPLSLVLSEAKEQRRAQGDNPLPILIVKFHHQVRTGVTYD